MVSEIQTKLSGFQTLAVFIVSQKPRNDTKVERDLVVCTDQSKKGSVSAREVSQSEPDVDGHDGVVIHMKETDLFKFLASNKAKLKKLANVQVVKPSISSLRVRLATVQGDNPKNFKHSKC